MKLIKFLSLMLLSIIMIILFVSCVAENSDDNDKNPYKGKSYTVTFEANGGNAVEPKTIKENQALSESIIPTKDGYKFDGWFLNAELTTEASFPITITNDVTLYAKWLKYHTVRFETNGGSSIESQVATEKDVIDSIKAPRKEDFVFDGWYLDAELTTVAIFPLSPKNDTVLYAKWLRVSDMISCKNVHLKCWNGYDDTATYYVTPAGFDLDRLNELGYTMKIIVTYQVYYEKDYDVPLGIGYAGAPEYNASLINSKNYGDVDEDMPTSTSASYRSLEWILNISDLKNEQLRLIFNTDNIQNIVYFKNITVSYTCY